MGGGVWREGYSELVEFEFKSGLVPGVFRSLPHCPRVHDVHRLGINPWLEMLETEGCPFLVNRGHYEEEAVRAWFSRWGALFAEVSNFGMQCCVGPLHGASLYLVYHLNNPMAEAYYVLEFLRFHSVHAVSRHHLVFGQSGRGFQRVDVLREAAQ